MPPKREIIMTKRFSKFAVVAAILNAGSFAHALDLNKVRCTQGGSTVITFAQKEIDFDHVGTVGGGESVDVVIGDERVPATFTSISIPSWPPVSQVEITLNKAFAGITGISIGQNGEKLSGQIKAAEGKTEPLDCKSK